MSGGGEDVRERGREREREREKKKEDEKRGSNEKEIRIIRADLGLGHYPYYLSLCIRPPTVVLLD